LTAIGVVEANSIPLGVLAGDAMVKTAAVDLVAAQTTCPGKYIVIVSGEVAAVRAAVSAGVENAGAALIDSLVIPNVDERVITAMAGPRLWTQIHHI
jgi:microcompartment protein CcmL/EutN